MLLVGRTGEERREANQRTGAPGRQWPWTGAMYLAEGSMPCAQVQRKEGGATPAFLREVSWHRRSSEQFSGSMGCVCFSLTRPKGSGRWWAWFRVSDDQNRPGSEGVYSSRRGVGTGGGAGSWGGARPQGIITRELESRLINLI